MNNNHNEEEIAKLCPTRRCIMKYGKVLTDDEFNALSLCSAGEDCRIQTILFNGHVYYQKTLNNRVVEFKELI